jgi:hypothetical protein
MITETIFCAAAAGQLGVLPVLQQLVLNMPLSGLCAAGPGCCSSCS